VQRGPAARQGAQRCTRCSNYTRTLEPHASSVEASSLETVSSK